MSVSCAWRSRTSTTPGRKPRAPRPTGFANGSNTTLLNEFYRVAFRKKLHRPSFLMCLTIGIRPKMSLVPLRDEEADIGHACCLQTLMF